MISSYFQLFDEPNKFVSVMEDLQTKVVENKEISTNINPASSAEIDKILSELFTEIGDIEIAREKEVSSIVNYPPN
jgi:hypothetical protein